MFKRKVLVLLVVLLLSSQISAQEGSEGVGDALYPQMGNGGYDVSHYTINLSVDMKSNSIEGSTSIEAIALEDLSRFNLDFSGLEISEILVNGEIADYERDDTELQISPAELILEDSEFTVNVSYSGSPEPIDDPAVPFTQLGWLEEAGGVIVLNSPSGAMSWYPVNNHPTDKASYRFEITVAEPYEVAANGLLEELINNGDTATYIWVANDPMAAYLSAVYIGEFEEYNSSWNELVLRSFFPVSSDIPREFEIIDEMMEFYSGLFGEYPFEVYGMIVIESEDFRGALENQTLSVFAASSLDEDTTAHELAHQWFGNSVSVKSWRDNWLSEGFATYLAALWLEHSEGSEVYSDYMDSLYNRLSREEGIFVAEPELEQVFDIQIYYRGAMTLHALRLELGDEDFFAVLREFYSRYEYSNASTEDFIAIAEEVTGEELDEFFEAWLYQTELPSLPE